MYIIFICSMVVRMEGAVPDAVAGIHKGQEEKTGGQDKSGMEKGGDDFT